MSRFLIYGANGYTGELIASEAVRRGLTPVIAGRSAAAIGRLSTELGCEGRIANLYDFTVYAALGVTERLLAGPGGTGYRTPSQIVGWRYIETLPGSGRLAITRGRAWEPRDP